MSLYLTVVGTIGIVMLLGSLGITLDKRDATFDRAAQEMCGGENAAWERLPDGKVQCWTKRGHKSYRGPVL